MTLRLVRTVTDLRRHLDSVRRENRPLGAVPTMGALHEGHLSLIRAAREFADEVVVTIFVNPTQFGPGEDFERYPRDLESDLRLAESAGATTVFAPPVSEMYPAGEKTRVRVSGITEVLCGAHRPGHFEGVTTIVAKLFHVVGPGVYCFGKKDFQQLRVIERMARDLLFPVEIVGCPIVRESDGMALSSRNRYLSEEQRKRATALSSGLFAARERFEAGLRSRDELRKLVSSHLDAGAVEIEYIEVRDAETLAASPELLTRPTVVAVAARVGTTRLIDNIELDPAPRSFDGPSSEPTATHAPELADD